MSKLASCVLALLLGPLASSGGLAAELSAGDFPREHIYDTSVHGDECAVNVSVTANRWPDCTTLESAVKDIFRLEGVQDASDQDKALALWKWYRILVSPTGGHYAYEGPPGQERICSDPHKIFTVYGHHQCDGLSWALVALWRAAGYMALDECTLGHTTAALRYRDADGQLRYHSFDPQHRVYHWDDSNQRVGTRSLPVMHGMVYRHLTAPQQIHSLRTSLRIGETIERQWDNADHLVPSGPDKRVAREQSYYKHRPGAARGVFAAVGQEVQTFEMPTQASLFASSIPQGSLNVTCSAESPEAALVHPQTAGQPAELVYRLAPPYVIADARCQATFARKSSADSCRLLISRDGQTWTPVFEMESLGEQQVDLDLGWEAWKRSAPSVYTAYTLYLKIEMNAQGAPRDVGLRKLTATVYRMLNKRTLPNLRPGRNVLRVTADQLTDGWGVDLSVNYRVHGEMRSVQRFITRFPHDFVVDVPDVREEAQPSYDQSFNEGPLRMESLVLRTGRVSERSPQPSELSDSEARQALAIVSPHPANVDRREVMARSERDVRETSGFFPQSDRAPEEASDLERLLQQLRGSDIEQRWTAAEALGAHPQALDQLLALVPKADGDLLLFVCKALAEIRDPRAIEPLLERWRQAPRGAPGSRYIPDVLAAIGDRRVVPQLLAPLPRCRFDYRFHIAHALGVLGGPEAAAALRELAEHDPFPAVREEAARGLE